MFQKNSILTGWVTTYWFLRPCTSLTRSQKYTWSLVLSQLIWYYCRVYQCFGTKNGEKLSCEELGLFLICFQINYRIYLYCLSNQKDYVTRFLKQKMNNTVFGAVIFEVFEAARIQIIFFYQIFIFNLKIHLWFYI